MKLLAILFLALCVLGDDAYDWLFDRVSDADVVGYRVEVATRVPTFYACVDEEGNVTECVSYPPFDSLDWTVADTVDQVDHVPDGWSLCSTWDSDGIAGVVVPEGRDAVLYINVRAVDSAGNVGN